MKNQIDTNVATTIECVKVYYIRNIELVEEIDKLIKKFEKESENIQTLDGENGPEKPPRGGGQ
jgi:uncharacterized protein Yka (UPF0111/DUF47 family)